MDWQERYVSEKRAGIVTDMARTIWPDAGAVAHDIAWVTKRVVDPGARAQALTTPTLLLHQLKSRMKGQDETSEESESLGLSPSRTER